MTSAGISQTLNFFDIIPDLGGLDSQGQALIVLPDTHEIYVMGDLIDTTLEPLQSVIRPFLAKFDYEGRMIGTHIIYDSLSQSKFYIDTRPIIKDRISILIYIDKLNEYGRYNANLLAIDIHTGAILRSKLYPAPPIADSTHIGGWYYRDSKKNLIVYHYLGFEKRIYIRKIDSLFNVTSEFLVNENSRWNAPKYIEAESDSTFILVGASIAPPGGILPEAKPFFMRVNKTGKILDFKLAPGITQKTVVFSSANSYTVLRDESGNWIISCVILEPNDNCNHCYNVIPISFSVSPEFDSLLWINYFSEVPYDSLQFYDLSSASWTTDRSGFVVSGTDFSLDERNSFLVKISTEGNTLWTRHFIPLGWEQERLSWADVEDVKATPHNTYVMVGVVFDNDLWIRRPWILHIDSMGCLIPGCDRIVSTHDSEKSLSNDFVIFPNPTSDQLYLMYRGVSMTTSAFSIYLMTETGQVLKSTKITPLSGGQYILPLYNVPPGQYIIRIEHAEQPYLQTNKIIKL